VVEPATSTIEQLSLGDYASIIGLIITLVGFAVTIYNVKKSRSSSEQAKESVNKMQSDLRRIDTVTDLTSAINLADEIKTLQRTNAWELVPEKYSELRKKLISVRESEKALNEDHQKFIQGSITQFSSSEKDIDVHLKNKTSPDSSKLNFLVSKHADNLQSVLVSLKVEIGNNYEL